MIPTPGSDTITATYSLPEGNQSEFERKLAKINRAARKIGVPEVTYAILETTTVPVRYRQEHPLAGLETGRVRRVHTIEVTGTRPIINGWTFIAAIRHFGADGNIVSGLPGFGIPAEYRTAGSDCVHCGHRRQRNNTYLLRNDAGDVKQVGSSCLVDFLGHKDPHAVAEMCSWYSELEVVAGADDDFEGGRGGHQDLYRLTWYLEWVALAVRTHGWVSRAAARDAWYKIPTAASAWNLMGASDGQGMTESERAKFVDDFVRAFGYKPFPSDDDIATANAAVEWALTLEDKSELNDYEHNLLVLARTDIVNHRVDGIAALMVIAYQRATDRAREAARTDRTPSVHIGTVGKRSQFILKLNRISTVGGGMYGPTYLHMFEDADGNRAKWFASSDSGMLEGGTYTVKATVKKHDVYEGKCETLLSRVALVETTPAAV